MQKLASDIDKATEALKAWGSSENNDLGVSPYSLLMSFFFDGFLAIGCSYCFNIPSSSLFFGSIAIYLNRPYHATPA
jgi:hypothetical protein